jgi:hypothetical protein
MQNFVDNGVGIGNGHIIDRIFGSKNDREIQNPPLDCNRDIKIIPDLLDNVCKISRDTERPNALWGVQTVIFLENFLVEYRTQRDEIVLLSDNNYACEYASIAGFTMAFNTPTINDVNKIVHEILDEPIGKRDEIDYEQLVDELVEEPIDDKFERLHIGQLNEQKSEQISELKEQTPNNQIIKEIHYIYVPTTNNQQVQKPTRPYCSHGYLCWNMNPTHLRKMKHYRTRKFTCTVCRSIGFTSFRNDNVVNLICNNERCHGVNTYGRN